MLRTLDSQQGQAEKALLREELPVFARDEAGVDAGKDVEACREMMEVMIGCQSTLGEKLQQMRERVEERTYDKGIGYFNAKNLMFLEYLIQLEFYELFRINAVDLTKETGLELYKRLVYLKTLLLKLSPVEKKLEYQKNKLLKLSDLVAVKSDQLKKNEVNEEGQQEDEEEEQDLAQESEGQVEEKEEDSEQDALAHQPRPQSLMAVKQKKEAARPKDGKYVAPKISAVLSKQDNLRRHQQMQEQRRKAHLVRRFRDDIVDDEEAREQGVENVVAEKIKRKFREKTSIEQDNFVRFPESKKDKYWKKQLIQRHHKTDELRDSFKEIEMVGKIFRSQAQEEQSGEGHQRSIQQLASHKKTASNNKPASHQTGSKRQKRQ